MAHLKTANARREALPNRRWGIVHLCMLCEGRHHAASV